MIRQHTRQAPVRPLVVATLCVVVLELVLPLTVLQTYDRFIPNHSMASLDVMLAAAGFCVLVEAAVRLARSVLMHLRGAAFSHQAGCVVMERILLGDPAVVGAQGTGRNLGLIGTARSLRESVSGQWLTSLTELAIIPLSLGLIAIIAGPLALVPLTLIFGFIFYAALEGHALRQARTQRQDCDSHRLSLMIEMFKGLATIKALALEQTMRRRYDAAKYESTIAHLAVIRRTGRLQDATASFGILMVTGMILAGAWLVVRGDITPGALIASVILSGRSVPPIQKGLSLFSRRQEMQIEKRQVDVMLELLPRPEEDRRQKRTENEGRMELRGLRLFRTGSAGMPITAELAGRDITLIDAESHQQLAALYRVLAGVQTPQAGHVVLNGQPVDRIADPFRSRQVCLLQANAALYRGTIMDNISRFGGVSVSDVLFISRQLGLDEDLAVLPRGYDTFLRGDAGDPIPPGLSQRIALARALAPRPRVILFNHADTGLDQRSYSALLTLLSRLRGHATLAISTNDNNLRGLASHHWQIANGKFTCTDLRAGRGREIDRHRILRM